MGSPRFKPTAEHRTRVRMLLSAGVPFDDTRQFIINANTGKPVGKNAFRRYFANEMVDGRTKYYGFVVGKLHNLIAEGNPAAIIFWLKCQGGWSTERGMPEIPLTIQAAINLRLRAEALDGTGPADSMGGDDDLERLAPGRLPSVYFGEAQKAPGGQ